MSKVSMTRMASGVALAVSMGFAGQASAAIYAGAEVLASNITINDLSQGLPPVAVGQFDFGVESSAGVAGLGGEGASSACTGNVANASTSCGNGGAGTPVLYAGNGGITFFGNGASQVGNGGAVLPSDYDTVVGAAIVGGVNGAPQGGNTNWASGDAIIDTATAVDAANEGANGFRPSALRMNGAVEINSAETGSANSGIITTTNFSTIVTVTNGILQIEMDVDPWLHVEFDDFDASDATTQATMSFTITVNGQGTGVDVTWTPNEVQAVAGACTGNVTIVGATCVSEQAAEDLNVNLALAPSELPQGDDTYSSAATAGSYLLRLEDLPDGDYAIGFAGSVSTIVSRVDVPVPGSLLLMGAGLTMFGMRRRRKA